MSRIFRICLFLLTILSLALLFSCSEKVFPTAHGKKDTDNNNNGKPGTTTHCLIPGPEINNMV